MIYKIFKLFFRIITLPIILLIYFIARIRDSITLGYYYLRYGGEFLTYHENLNPKTILELLKNATNNKT